jgi:hypothetical protein
MTGTRDGDEVAQVYLRQRDSDARWRLVGFKRIFLRAGEQKTLAFNLPAEHEGPLIDQTEASGPNQATLSQQ